MLRPPNSVIVGQNVRLGISVVFDSIPGKCTYLGDDVIVGAGAVIGAGITIGQGAQIAPGAVILESVPPNAKAEGNPGRIIGYVQSENRPVSTVVQASDEKLGSQDLGVGGARLYKLQRITDMRGALTVGEIRKDLPFAPERYFIVFDVPSSELRGEHAHYSCHQFLICTHGSCRLLLDDGARRCEVTLDRPDFAVYMPPMIWGTQYRYSTDAVLLVFASHTYDPDDYIRTYDAFLEAVQEQRT